MVGVCLWRSRGEAGRGRRGGALGGAGSGAHTRPRPPRLALRLLPRSAHPRFGGAVAAFFSSSWALAALEVGGGPGGGAARLAGHLRGRPGSAWRPGSCALERGQNPGAQGAAGAREGGHRPHLVGHRPPPPARPPLPEAGAQLHTHLLSSSAPAPQEQGGVPGPTGAAPREAGKARGTPAGCSRAAPRDSPGPSAPGCSALPRPPLHAPDPGLPLNPGEERRILSDGARSILPGKERGDKQQHRKDPVFLGAPPAPLGGRRQPQ